MSVLDSIKGIIPDELAGDESSKATYRCRDCGTEFETAKVEEQRISCPECLENDVEPVDA